MSILLVVIAGGLGMGACASHARSGVPLRWRPPALRQPVVVELDDRHLDVGLRSDQVGRDVLVRCPSKPLRGDGRGGPRLWLGRARNVVLIGCAVDIGRRRGSPPSAASRTCLRVDGGSGITHIEGLRCTGSDLSEGIDFTGESPGQIMQFENIYIGRLRARRECRRGLSSRWPGCWSDNHPDLLQTWSGPPGVVRVDRFTGTTPFQGFYFGATDRSRLPIRRISLSRVNIHSATHPTMPARQLLIDGSFRPPLRTPTPKTLSHVYLDRVRGMPAASVLYPSPRFWRGARFGRHPDYVRPGDVGPLYESPGYLDG